MTSTPTILNILVVDDEINHRRSAEILLKGHNLTIADSYDAATTALSTDVDYDLFQKMKTEAGLVYPREGTDQEKAAYQQKYNELQEKARRRPNFDVVLLDLLMPASSKAQGPTGIPFVGKQLPMGTFLILLAMKAGVKNIGMVTDTNHHNHPASAAIDPMNGGVITAGDVRIFATNYAHSVCFDQETGERIPYEFLRGDEGKQKYPETDGYTGDCQNYKGAFWGKGWNAALNILMGRDEGVEGA